ncbi:MAG: M1 family metallopeptidase [Candidatus Micrarchaeota archaeon]|nr:M1 family metallopeptidase [Candidatus Micrarchaeota archaeon]
MATAKHKTLGDKALPLNYRLRFEPNLKTFKFKGSAAITVEIKKSANLIKLNAKELEISEANVTAHGKIQKCRVSYDKKEEEIALRFTDKISGKALISIEFTGLHNNQMDGFYRSKYLYNGKEGNIVTTQFEAVSARKAFPCIDEPIAKATFDVTMIVEKDLSAISNMPIKKSIQLNSTKKAVTFYTTPRMSTYLLYLAAGKFEFRSGKLGKLPIRIVAVPGQGKYTGLAMVYTKQFLKYFEEYFGMKYQLPKLDMIAIPDFSEGAMENWGAITFRDVHFLSDPKNTSVMAKQLIAETIAHELAHQWFGDLVTMAWWDDIWLNESFATFMSYKAMDVVYPKWGVEDKYIIERVSIAFTMDQLKTTHPINMPVRNPTEIKNLFDEISYHKGGAVLQMIEDYIGKEAFREGLREYLKAHSYSNATKKDLWGSIDKAAKKRGRGADLKRLAEAWVNTPGYPIVNVENAGAGKLRLSQERYLLADTKRYEQVWPIPIRYALPGKRLGFTLLNHRSADLKYDGTYIKLNYGQKGLYRARYPEKIAEKLGGLIAAGKVAHIDEWGIENDMFALARSTRSKVSDYVDFVERYCMDIGFPANITLSGHLSGLATLLDGRINTRRLKEVNLKYNRKLLKQLGWARKGGELDAVSLLRGSVIAALGIAGDAEVKAESKRLFDAYVNEGKAIDANIRSAVFANVALDGDTRLHEKFVELYKKAEDSFDILRIMRALGSFRDKELLKKSLAFSLSKDMRLQNAHYIPATIASRSVGRELLWEWTKDNWKVLLKRYDIGSPNALDVFVDNLAALDTVKAKTDIIKFFSKKGNMRDDIKKAYVQSLEFIDSNIRLIEANK